MTVTSTAPSVFDADLPSFSYTLAASPHDILDDVRSAQARAPIAIGPFGPEVLSYEFARDMLRDNRFRLPPASLWPHRESHRVHCSTRWRTACWVSMAKHMSGYANWCPRRSPPRDIASSRHDPRSG